MSIHTTGKKNTVLSVDDQPANIHASGNIIKKDYAIQAATTIPRHAEESKA